MKNINKIFLIFLLVLPIIMQANETTKAKEMDVIYKTTKQGPVHLDLYYPSTPKSDDRFPLVLFYHGGGWAKGNRKIGDKGGRKMFLDAFLAKGFCLASVEYRLASRDGKITMEDIVSDSKDAIRYLVKNAKKYSIDTNNIFTFGDSAGGHISQMVLLSPIDSFPGDPKLADAKWRFAAGVSWYGPCDFEKLELFKKPDGTGNLDRFADRIMRGDETPEEKIAQKRKVSPVNYLKADNPPLLMLQGDKDPCIPVHHAHYMKERAEKVKAPVTTIIIKNASHCWNAKDGELSISLEEIISKTVDFMKKNLKEK